MLSNASLIGFIPTKNPERGREFYQQVVGLTFVSQDNFAVVFKSGNNTIRLINVQELTPPTFTILGWEVEDIDAEVKAFRERGVTFQRYTWIQQDDLDIWTAPGGSRIAWFNDPDGNILSLSQHVG